METTIGGDRLGSGSKQTTSFRNYERSTHDLSYTWKSSMASGTLVPFMVKVALPGDKWSINLNTDVLTLPTIGPLFGSYKVQLDVFEVPMRLYNAKLHMNRLGIGMNMSEIKLPLIEVRAVNLIASGYTPKFADNSQINASCILKYLGISGLGAYNTATPNPLVRNFNAVPYLAYWEIYKNYYANKQEEIGAFLHTTAESLQEAQTPTMAALYDYDNLFKGYCLQPETQTLEPTDNLNIYYPSNAVQPNIDSIPIQLDGATAKLSDAFNDFNWDDTNKIMFCGQAKVGGVFYVKKVPSGTSEYLKASFSIKTFDLNLVDLMRDNILQHSYSSPFTIKHTFSEPWSAPLQLVTTNFTQMAAYFAMEGLALKTYQSDLFNNWISSEWIDGTGGISELTAVDTTEGSFTIDALNIASKVYDMLNRIAVSGGTYDDWLEAVYTHERVKGVESPLYHGSLIKELSFEEVISTAATNVDNKLPLGTLAGRGRLTGKHKGGKIEITVNEPGYIMGIVSITPRVDYSQGNEWHTNLLTMDDLHKPALDGIGFQDLITDQMLWSDTIIGSTGTLTKHSLGKQPAWINYMTEINKTYGAFAEPENSMFMTLNRRYDRTLKDGYEGRLKDGTTYIDPSKFNNIFAETAMSAQNFWVQIACDITARRKMSAKIIPNL